MLLHYLLKVLSPQLSLRALLDCCAATRYCSWWRLWWGRVSWVGRRRSPEIGGNRCLSRKKRKKMYHTSDTDCEHSVAARWLAWRLWYVSHVYMWSLYPICFSFMYTHIPQLYTPTLFRCLQCTLLQGTPVFFRISMQWELHDCAAVPN